MGEARRRAQAVAAGTAEPRGVMIRLREKVCLFEPEVYSAIERERAAFNDGHSATLGFDIYLNALLQTALERERQAREALAAAAKTAAEIRAKENEQPSEKPEAFPGAALLDGMAPAVARGDARYGRPDVDASGGSDF